MLRNLGIEGRVAVRAVVDTSGMVTNAEIYASSGYQLFDQSVIDAILKYRFTPRLQRTRKVPVEIIVTFDFKLH